MREKPGIVAYQIVLALVACEVARLLATPPAWSSPLTWTIWALGATAGAIAASRWLERRIPVPGARSSLALVGAMVWTTICLVALTIAWQPPFESRHAPSFAASTWEVAASQLLALAALPIMEETIVRGYLLLRLRAQMGAVASVAVSAITFSLARRDAANGVADLLIGIVLAALVLITGRFWLAPVVRVAVGCGAILLSRFLLSAPAAPVSDVVTTICGVLALLALLGLHRVLRAQHSRSSANEEGPVAIRDALPSWMP